MSVEKATEIVRNLPAEVTTVGVFVNESLDRILRVVSTTGITTIQLHGEEPAALAGSLGRPLIRSVTLDDAARVCKEWPVDTTLLVDALDPVRRGGTGIVVDWSRAAAIARERRVVLAGGLTPSNVADAIAAVRPYGVDVSSGVEAAPGVKDLDKVTQFLANARSAFEAMAADERPVAR